MTLLDDDLRRAVRGGAITAAYQPQIDLAEGRMVSAEVLARWDDPQRGPVPPLEFIPVAERSDIIHDLGRTMLDAGFDAARAWSTARRPIEVSVNVSVVQLVDRAFDDEVARRLESAALPPGSVTLEITETHSIFEVPGIAQRLELLHALGAEISIDDVGTGFAPVQRIDELPVSELKIDRSIVQDPTAAAEATMAGIIGFAHDRGIRVVGEGVETPEQRDRLARLACDRGQGFLFGYPMPREEIDAIIAGLDPATGELPIVG